MEPDKGTGAGGANTNFFGKKFVFASLALSKTQYYLFKKNEDDGSVAYFMKQTTLKAFVKEKFNIELFRCPDECYITVFKDGKKHIKILEKKHQRVEGSVESKLWCGNSFKREYQIVLGEDFTVEYGFCVNDYLKKKVVSDTKKFVTLRKILEEDNIEVLFGNDDDYFEKLDAWVEK